MKKVMKEYKLDLTGTAEEQDIIAENPGKPMRISFILDMPRDPIVRRINTRILQHKRTGINPQTKEMGEYIVQEECVYLWAEVDAYAPLVSTRFEVIQSEHEVPECPYAGTFLLQAGALVFHVYGPQVVKE